MEQANLDPDVHVIALAGEGKGFCGGYDLVWSAEQTLPNHDPGEVWDPVLDWQFMSRNVRGFMSLFHSDKPVVCKVHGFCVAGGTDMALCSDLLVIADDARDRLPARARLGRPDDDAVGAPHRRREGEADALHRRPDHRRPGEGVGARDRGAARRPSSTRRSRRSLGGSRRCR